MNILIIRLSAIGDIVMSSPLIGALRQQYPDAKLSWLAQRECADLLTNDPDLHEVIVWPRREWAQLFKQRKFLRLIGEIRGFRRELRARDFELVLDCQGLLKSGFLAWLSGAPKRIGLGSREGSQWLMTSVIERGGDEKQMSSEYCHLANHLGLDTQNFEMRLATSSAADAAAKALLSTHGVDGEYNVICPFTTRPQKHWFADAWIELITLLANNGGHVIMLGGPGDVEAGQQIADQSDIVNLVGATDLLSAAALIRGCRALVGVDTGLTHMGVVYQRPMVALFGSTRPYLETSNPSAKIIYHNLSCSPCHRSPTCDGKFTCMRDITASEVIDHLTTVLPA